MKLRVSLLFPRESTRVPYRRFLKELYLERCVKGKPICHKFPTLKLYNLKNYTKVCIKKNQTTLSSYLLSGSREPLMAHFRVSWNFYEKGIFKGGLFLSLNSEPGTIWNPFGQVHRTLRSSPKGNRKRTKKSVLFMVLMSLKEHHLLLQDST